MLSNPSIVLFFLWSDSCLEEILNQILYEEEKRVPSTLSPPHQGAGK